MEYRGDALNGANVEPVLVPDIPHLEQEALALFDRYVSNVGCYLEYGAGGSTVRAAQLGAQHVVSVDSSREWVKAVRASVGDRSQIYLLHCDIGIVGAWGRPTDQQGLRGYHAYMSLPWSSARRKTLTPNMVLIDGRFRVACFLYSLICAQPGTIILFDDYVNRERYHVVEEFCRPTSLHGRMALFTVDKGFALEDIVARIAEYSIISE